MHRTTFRPLSRRLRRCVEDLDSKTRFLAPGEVNEKPWHHGDYDPLWAQCERLGIPISFQGGGRTLLTPGFSLELFADRLMMCTRSTSRSAS